jgi:hypothetical protein
VTELFPDGTTEVVHEVFAIVRPTDRLLKVTKLTKSQVVASVGGREVRFDRSTGDERGVDHRIGHHSKIVPATDKARDAARRSTALDRIEMLAYEAERWAKNNPRQSQVTTTTTQLETAAARLSEAMGLLRKAPSNE